jgi:hypothetical protein
MKNGTIFNVFGEPIEILASSSATNYAFVTGLQTSANLGPGRGPLRIVTLERAKSSR